MSDVIALIADLIRAGVDPELIGRVADAIASREAVLVPDAQAEKRRERDRERKRFRGIPQISADSADPSPQSEEPTLPSETENHQTPHPSPYSPPSLSFSAFWLAYPNKVGKRAAETAYQRATKRINHGANPAETIMAGLERAKLSRAWSEGYIPHPATWLNQDRWEDEPDETPRLLQPTAGMLAAAEEELGFRRAIERMENEHRERDRLGDQSLGRALPAPSSVGNRTRPLDH